MDERFDKFIKIILQHEGGYVNDPDDMGGETKYGITKLRYPDLDIKNLTIDQAKEIYREDFYQEMKLQFIKDDLLAMHVLDMAINIIRKSAPQLNNSKETQQKRAIREDDPSDSGAIIPTIVLRCFSGCCEGSKIRVTHGYHNSLLLNLFDPAIYNFYKWKERTAFPQSLPP